MALNNDFSPIISNDLGQGLGVYGNCTPYNSTLQNNGALVPPGSVTFIPGAAQSQNVLVSTKGYGAGLWVKYVLYKSTANPAVVTGPAPVYYVDETFSTVSGVFTEGNPAATGNSSSVAGWLLPNSGTVAGIGAGTTAFTATVLNNGGLGSWVYIGLTGFIPSAWVTAGAIGNPLTGAAGNWVTAVTTTILRPVAYVWSAVSSGIADIVATVQPF
jgi:hypothetical protein